MQEMKKPINLEDAGGNKQTKNTVCIAESLQGNLSYRLLTALQT